MTEKTGFKYSVKFNQSLSTGMIAFEGYFAFDEWDDYERQSGILTTVLEDQIRQFTALGFKCASIIPNNLKELANTKSTDASSRKLGVKPTPEVKEIETK